MSFFDQIILFLHTDQAYWVIYLTMVGCGIGLPLNGDLIMLFLGSLSGLGHINPIEVSLICIFGLLTGDSCMHFIGKKIGFKIVKFWPLSKLINIKKLYKAHRYSRLHGPKIVFFIRFIPGTRTVTVLASGIFKLPFFKFFIMNLCGLIILCPLLVTLGHFFIASLGDAKEKAVPILFCIFVCSLIILFLVKKLNRLNTLK